ncbi:barstar family protein [Ruminococcus sp. NK3A76]|uniref:barstar family protein n=1 Tax=Ruminococcus sp. NK3A76 TaxID=877411 RepID=UPI00048AED8A|nr:barstar family protein [Ruminococcus sp. NK3A76]
MTLLLDDAIFQNKDNFFYYINNNFGDRDVFDTDALFNVLSDDDPDIEVILSDFDDLKGEAKEFASEILKVLYDAKNANPNLKIINMSVKSINSKMEVPND